MVEKFKLIRDASADLFQTISWQAARLVDSTDTKQDEDKLSISQCADKLASCLSVVQDILENFYTEEQVLFAAGTDL
jgi:hypothetical protein